MKHNKILIVDKEKSWRQEICRLLEEAPAGYKTAHAGSIREATELARGFYPHLVVTDALLPDGDGYDLYMDLRASRPNLPVLFLCADDDETARLRGLGFAQERWMTRREAAREIVARAEKMIQRVYERAATGVEEES